MPSLDFVLEHSDIKLFPKEFCVLIEVLYKRLNKNVTANIHLNTDDSGLAQGAVISGLQEVSLSETLHRNLGGTGVITCLTAFMGKKSSLFNFLPWNYRDV